VLLPYNIPKNNIKEKRKKKKKKKKKKIGPSIWATEFTIIPGRMSESSIVKPIAKSEIFVFVSRGRKLVDTNLAPKINGGKATTKQYEEIIIINNLFIQFLFNSINQFKFTQKNYARLYYVQKRVAHSPFPISILLLFSKV